MSLPYQPAAASMRAPLTTRMLATGWHPDDVFIPPPSFLSDGLQPLRASMDLGRSLDLRASMDRSMSATSARHSRPQSPLRADFSFPADRSLSQSMHSALQAHFGSASISGYGSQTLQTALHTSGQAAGRGLGSAYSYYREGENLRHASVILNNLRGELEASADRLQPMSGSLEELRTALMAVQAELDANKAEVKEREGDHMRARRDLLSQVEQAVTESTKSFQEGRVAMVKSLAEYQTACTNMFGALKEIKDIATELEQNQVQSFVPKPIALPGGGITVVPGVPMSWTRGEDYRKNIVASPLGSHVGKDLNSYTSPMGTVRPIAATSMTVA